MCANFTTSVFVEYLEKVVSMEGRDLNWKELGERIAMARKVAGLSQERLGQPLNLDRSAVSRIESGNRTVDSLELSRLASELDRPLDWFLRPLPQTVVSRRDDRQEKRLTAADFKLEDLVSDVELLLEFGTLSAFEPEQLPIGRRLRNAADAEAVAQRARVFAGSGQGPVADLIDVAERLGLLVFVLDIDPDAFEGAYVALPTWGIAVIASDLTPGRRRYTMAHELGHHVLEDEFDTFSEMPTARSRREKLINAFAVHFLLPREGVSARFSSLRNDGYDTREAALFLGQEYAVSWTALCAQLKTLKLIDEKTRKALAADVPGAADFLELGLRLPPNDAATKIPGVFARAVIRAYKSNKLSAERAVEMLRGEITKENLPTLPPAPLDSLIGEIERPL